ncbi:septal ring lytic transglycosylase RlpA family protein [Croceibacterium sp. TMG7-5b_MA50]|uniref:septal ring lytic transglycosylase RlpA family protein n=1 Tax=Croceibacterium sp. TMG7-5b_MA50 TaxID=3121290 RepID=UPI0032221F93
MEGLHTMKRIALAALALAAAGTSLQALRAEEVAQPLPASYIAPNDADLPRFQIEDDLVVEDAGEAIDGGVASWYGPGLAGRPTASGETFDPGELTAAHRTLPFGSLVRVSRGDQSVIVRINDRGPFHGNRVIDLSTAAAERIGLRRAGSGRVQLALLNS